MNVLSEQDACYNSATAINGVVGVVYYMFSTGKKPIGYYEPVNNGSGVNIYRELNKGLIGYICGKDIFLSRQVMYDHACKIRNECGSKYPVKVPIPMTLKVAETNNGHIMEIQNYTWVGTCQQNEYAAAAAFVCLIYECLLYHELHDFYFQWDK